ncbi:MAG: PLDc N-terminal domain-containing protein [Eubacteriales bacterium]
MEILQQLQELLPIIIPLIILQLTFAFVALYHLLKHKRVRFFGVLPWVFIILFVNLLGPVLYFLIGREEE